MNLLTRTLILACAALAPATLQANEPFPLVAGGIAADIRFDPADWKVVHIAANDLALDVGRVTGLAPACNPPAGYGRETAVILGTIGRSRLVDELIAAGRLDAAEIRGQWESFVITPVDHPMPGVRRALVIAGSDRRGTAYGAYELSRRIGVSPWYWWADVTPRHQDELRIPGERVRVGPPAVKYRGIFINDEMWGIRPWAEGTHAPDEGKGLGPKTHARIFELLLRLRANHLWPAMHLHTTPFNAYPENARVADDYAIVMGSSHIEPMLRNNMPHAEWDREDGGEWNYLVNRGPIRKYWERRIITNGRFENVYTLGMRGKDDEPMYGDLDQAGQIGLLETIFADQRAILARHVDPDPARVPQVFIPYTEVLGLYDAGLKVPGDVILCWPDDNFGYLRRLPTAAERARPGGSGLYYHIQWINGATSAYPWLNTMPPALMATELTRAWNHGVDRLWVLNVGDIKPGEIGMEFFLDMAWDPDRRKPQDVREFLAGWARRDLDPRFAGEIADLMMEYFQLGFTRRPEHLVQFKAGEPLEYSWFSHELHNDEAGRRLERYAAIARRAREIHGEIPRDRADAFFQLVRYPVECAWLMNRKVIHADLSLRDAAAGRATARGHARIARESADRILALTETYNEDLVTAGDKWRHMMTATPGPWGSQRHQFEMPPLSDYDGVGPPALQVVPEGGKDGVLADLSGFTRGRRFIDLFNTGKGAIKWRATASHPWLKPEAAAGEFTTGQRIWIRVDWETVPATGHSTATLRFTSNAGEAEVSVPVFKPAFPSRDEVHGHIESHGHVTMEAEHFSRRIDRGGASWRVVDGLGRVGAAVTVQPADLPSRTDEAGILAHSPALEYDLHVFHTGAVALHIDCLPTLPSSPDRGARLAVALNGGPPVILRTQARDVPTGTLANLRCWTLDLEITQPGDQKLTVWMVDPGVILDRLSLHTAKQGYSYLGPQESWHRLKGEGDRD